MNNDRNIKITKPFTPLEAERSVASRGDECGLVLANAWFNAPCELLMGFTYSRGWELWAGCSCLQLNFLRCNMNSKI